MPSLNDAAELGRRHNLRAGIAVIDLDSGQEWTAGDLGQYGAASVVKVLIAAKMLLTGAMTGADAATAYEMVTRSDDADCNALWGRFGDRSIITWLNSHYRIAIGTPNPRPNFWGNTQVTPDGMARFYLAASRDPRVWPWLQHAMAGSQRLAADGTDQFFGIPGAGGGHVVKQGWASASSGNGYAPDATVNTTGIVTSNGHRYAVAILTEGHGNDPGNDARGLNHAEATAVTSIASVVLKALPGLSN